MQKAFFAVVGLSVALFLTTMVIAKEIEVSPSPLASPSASPSIEYFLPYPGLLPDHPLYPIKAIRDKMLSVLISDPVKRVEFNLLMADKRLNMGILLSEKGKEALAETTVSKAEKYFLDAAEGFARLPRESANGTLLDRLVRSGQKHADSVKQMRDKTSSAFVGGYGGSLEIVDKANLRLQNLR